MACERSDRSVPLNLRACFFAAMSHLPRSPQDPYGPVVSAASCYTSMIPGQGLFVVTPSGIEHSRSPTGTQGPQEESSEARPTPDPSRPHDRPPRRRTTPTACQLSSPPARTPPQTHPDSRTKAQRRRDLLSPPARTLPETHPDSRT